MLINQMNKDIFVAETFQSELQRKSRNGLDLFV